MGLLNVGTCTSSKYLLLYVRMRIDRLRWLSKAFAVDLQEQLNHNIDKKEAVDLKRQEELIREEEEAWMAESEQKAKRGASEKEKKKKKQDNDQNEYNPSPSNRSKPLTCSHQLCELGPTCKNPKQPCPYTVKYASTDTSSSGSLLEVILHLASDGINATNTYVRAPVIIGCGKEQSGGYLDGIASDGVLGLGLGEVSVPSLLAKSGRGGHVKYRKRSRNFEVKKQELVQYKGPLPRCNICNFHHGGAYYVSNKCNQTGHYYRYCKANKDHKDYNRACYTCILYVL